MAVRDKAGSADKEFLIRWEGCDAKGNPWPDTWEPRDHMHPTEIKQFLQQNDLYDYSGHRCPYCDRKCKSQHGVKIHKNHCLHRPDKQQFAGTCADRKVKKDKQELAQKSKPKVKCEHHELKNVLRFKYLGSIFSADGQHIHDVVRRSALATARCGLLRQVFSSKLSIALKLKIYITAVTSLLTYGSEAWHLTPATLAKINGTNARCLSRITGNTSRQEASRNTRTYDLVAAVRHCRFVWLGHILRMNDNRLVKIAARV